MAGCYYHGHASFVERRFELGSKDVDACGVGEKSIQTEFAAIACT